MQKCINDNASNCWDTLNVGNQQASRENGSFNDYPGGGSTFKRREAVRTRKGDDIVWPHVKA